MNRRSTGFSMAECLVSMLVIGIGLLGIAGLQTRAQQAELEAYQRSQALILVTDMANRLSANRSIAECYVTNGFVGAGTTPQPCLTYSASARRDRAEADLAEWVAVLEGTSERVGTDHVGSITGARGCITAGADPNVYVISVAWQGMNPTEAPGNPCASGQYGSDDLRRVVSTSLRFADLTAN